MTIKHIGQRILKAIIDHVIDQQVKTDELGYEIEQLEEANALLERKNEFMSELLRDIERTVDSGTDSEGRYLNYEGQYRQISVGIKRWRHELSKDNLLESKIKPGLVRE